MDRAKHPPDISRRGFLRSAVAGATAITAFPTVLLSCGGGGSSGGGGGSKLISKPDVAKAKQEGTVSLYTSLDTKILGAINQAFTQKYGIKVVYYRSGATSAVTNKVMAEASVGQVKADVVDASDVAGFLLMASKGVLRPYDSPEVKSVAKDLRDKDGRWTADRLTQAVIQYNTNAVTEPPKHWKDLTDPRFQGKLAFFDSGAGEAGYRLYALAKQFGWDLLQGYAKNKPLRVSTPQLVTQVLERGERAVGFAQNDNIAWRSRLDGKPTDYLMPAEGVPTEPGCVGVTAKAPHPNAALLYFDFWMGREGQQLLVKGGKYSSRTDLAPPKGEKALKDIKRIPLDFAAYQKERPSVLKHMARIFGGQWGTASGGGG
jgi:iron(III) transport system substrate-binding protein